MSRGSRREKATFPPESPGGPLEASSFRICQARTMEINPVIVGIGLLNSPISAERAIAAERKNAYPGSLKAGCRRTEGEQRPDWNGAPCWTGIGGNQTLVRQFRPRSGGWKCRPAVPNAGAPGGRQERGSLAGRRRSCALGLEVRHLSGLFAKSPRPHMVPVCVRA